MNWLSWLLWGFVATLVLSSLSAASQGLGLTRMNIPFLLGMMVTSDRNKAKFYGFILHTFNGWLFSLLYVFAFESWRRANWWMGALAGIVHALFVLLVGMPLLPGLHPRMASEQHGPTAHRMLEPPGFLALNYGIRTPVAILLAHAVFGAILGAFYQLR
jgi:hypothetical protein